MELLGHPRQLDAFTTQAQCALVTEQVLLVPIGVVVEPEPWDALTLEFRGTAEVEDGQDRRDGEDVVLGEDALDFLQVVQHLVVTFGDELQLPSVDATFAVDLREVRLDPLEDVAVGSVERIRNGYDPTNADRVLGDARLVDRGVLGSRRVDRLGRSGRLVAARGSDHHQCNQHAEHFAATTTTHL